MTTQQTFKNAKVRTFHNDYVELDVAGKLTCLNNCMISSIVDGDVTVVWKNPFISGDFIQVYVMDIWVTLILKDIDTNGIHFYATETTTGEVSDNQNYWATPKWWNGCIRKASPEAVLKMHAKLAEKGLVWNPITKHLDVYKWCPKTGQMYFYINAEGIIQVRIWSDTKSDKCKFKLGNCFKSMDDATAKLAAFKRVFE